MPAWCLTKEASQRFKKALKDRELDPFKMAVMTSAERRSLIAKFIGEENAKQVNALYESKVLLKNKKAGYISWAKKVGGITPEVRRDLISKIERMDKILDPKEEDAFLEDLVNKRLGIEVTQEEAKKISELSKRVSELEKKTDKTKSDIALGRAKLDLTDYVNELGGKKAGLVTNIAGVPRTLMSSIDLSAPFNQGWGMISRKRFYTSLARMFKYAASESAFRDLQAEIITHPVYNIAKKAGLRLTDLGDKLEMREEQFMSTLLDKVPGISASQRAYTGFLNKLRIDSFYDLIRKAEVAGEDVGLGSKAAEDLAKAVNDFTGGARVGKIEGAVPMLNATFFSPRKIKSTVNMMNPVNYVNPKISKTARLERTRNMIGSLALSIGVIALYSMLTGKKQETDPTSSDFGKIRSGDTRIDVTGGNGTYAILLARLISQRIKNSSGVSRELGTGFGETSGADLIAQFLRYKLSPNASLLVDAVTGTNAVGEKKTIPESVIDRFKPMFANSLVELLKSDTEGKVFFALTGLLGAGLNTYKQKTDWELSESAEIKAFKKQVGEKQFKKANDDYNRVYNWWLEKTIPNESYKRLSNEAKETTTRKAKEKIKDMIFKANNFKYKQKKEKKTQETQTIKNLLP